MASDIEKAVKNHDELVINLTRTQDSIVEVGKERHSFKIEFDKIRNQMRGYENFINEARGKYDNDVVLIK